MSHVTPMFLNDPADYHYQIVGQSEQSWWVFREPLDQNSRPLPYGAVIYFARSYDDAADWIATRQGGCKPAQAA